MIIFQLVHTSRIPFSPIKHDTFNEQLNLYMKSPSQKNKLKHFSHKISNEKRADYEYVYWAFKINLFGKGEYFSTIQG
jgi:hypothetical protein